MAKIVIEIGSGKILCNDCHKLQKDSDNKLYCGEFGDQFRASAYKDCCRLPACQAAGNGYAVISRDIAKQLLDEIEVDIDNFGDDPRTDGHAPRRFYDMRRALKAALEGEG